MSDAPYIRNVLRLAVEARRCIRDMKPAERIARDDLGSYLTGVINRLKGLEIPARLKEEIMVREAEIGACEDAIRDWLKARGQTAPLQRVTASLVSPNGERMELGEGYMLPPEGEVSIEAPKAYETDGNERLYARGRVMLRVIDGGKK